MAETKSVLSVVYKSLSGSVIILEVGSSIILTACTAAYGTGGWFAENPLTTRFKRRNIRGFQQVGGCS